MSKKKTFRVRQTGSGIREPRRVRATLRGLGLGKIGRVRTLQDTPGIRGMARKIAHLVRVEET